MPFYERGDVRIRYEEAGSGFPLLLIPGGGLNATVGFFTNGAPFDPFARDDRCIRMHLRNVNDGQSSGPVDVDRAWDSYPEDQLGLMDHLVFDRFMVMGFCIACPTTLLVSPATPARIAPGNTGSLWHPNLQASDSVIAE